MGMERTDHTVSPTGELNAVCVGGAARETPTHIFYGTYVSRLINFGELNGKQKPTKNLKLVLEADTSDFKFFNVLASWPTLYPIFEVEYLFDSFRSPSVVDRGGVSFCMYYLRNTASYSEF